ncbi:MAG: M23 family metallopeptidase [Sphingomonadales bacterium]|nr:M23 family metallopeptidase [Sphingomonadales bacterium]
MIVAGIRRVGAILLRAVIVAALSWVAIVAWLNLRDHPAPPPAAKVPPAAAVPRPVAATASQPLIVPVTGVGPASLVDTFDQARAAGARRHDALDIPAPRGTPVVAAAPGRVEKLFLSKDGGNTVYVRSDDGRTIYYYAHLDAYAPGLAEGAMLAQGAPLGMVGSTGDADPAAPHLHFAIWQTAPQRKWWETATPINPYPLLRRPGDADF